MQPFRNLLMTLSRIPPLFMLLIIVGLAATVTTMVTSQMKMIDAKADLEQKRIAAEENQTAGVVFAVKDVSEGEVIPSDALESRNIQVRKIPADALSSCSLAAGRVAKYGVSAGTIVSQHDLAPIGISPGFESKLPEGLRALTFGVDNNTGVAGFVGPDSRVDILALVGTAGDTKAWPVLSDVRIIAAGQSYQRAPGQTTAIPTSNVTVAVTPEDARKLLRAMSASKLYLTLRNEHDHSPVATTDISNLFAKAPIAVSSNSIPLPPPGPNPEYGILPTPPIVGNSGDPQANATQPKANYEIEMWSGSKKDVLSLANH
jgi:Flp pilus assembly protein CpaB